MGTLLDDNVGFQLMVWGYAITGEATEFSAIVSEMPVPPLYKSWDSTRSDLDRHSLCDGVTWWDVPDWWALRWLPDDWCETAMRGGHLLRTRASSQRQEDSADG